VCALSACGDQNLNGGVLLDHSDAEATGNPSIDSADWAADVPVAVVPVGSGGVSGGSGGSNSPSNGGESGAVCSTVVPCGGDLVGIWTVTSSCLQVSGQADLSTLGLGCASAPIVGTVRVTGMLAARSDGAYWGITMSQTGDMVLALPASCLEVSGTVTTCPVLAKVLLSLGYATTDCAPAANGGCTCSATVKQASGLGQILISTPAEGTYKTADNVVTFNDVEKYSYCVAGSKMTWTPQSAGLVTTGAVVFEGSNLVGTGGSSGSGGAEGKGGSTGAGGATVTGTLPCDVYAGEGGPCVAAHSTVRALSSAYTGPLYQVRRVDGTLHDIPVGPGGFADASVQDAFCGGSSCTISTIYDQSGRGNHLTKAPGGGAKVTAGNEANAKALPMTFSGHKVYGVHVVDGVGYRNDNAVGTAMGDDSETIYMVADGKYYNAGCCFDYGNAETNNNNKGEGAVEAVYFGACTVWGMGAGEGPWVMGDLENGLWAGSVSPYTANPSVTYNYVTAMVKGDAAGTNHWMIKVGNAQSGAIATVFDGSRPSARYSPMRKEGAIILGIAGDNSNAALGNFFEGIMTAHFSSDPADRAVQASIVSAYGQ